MSNLTDIILPADQAEGTKSVISSWLKQPGETVRAHEPLVEIETDKVVVEVSAPQDGVLAEIIKVVGVDVEPGELLGRITLGQVLAEVLPTGKLNESRANGVGNKNNDKNWMSPSVRRLVDEHKIDIHQINGSGRNGRVTKHDVENFLQNPAASASAPDKKVTAMPVASVAQSKSGIASHDVIHDPMRKRIAEHMVQSLLITAPHVTSVFELDMSSVMAHYAKHKSEYQQQGIKLTISAYFISAAVTALQAVPEVNSRFYEQHLEVFDDINIGMGVALDDKGLVVPVIHQAQQLGLLNIASRLQDITARARAGQLKPADVQNGTFTISNHGVSGSLLATPIIINQPQSAILGIGKLEKRVVVKETADGDSMAIRPMCYVTLTIDHRVLDAFHTNKFLTTFVETLENWS